MSGPDDETDRENDRSSILPPNIAPLGDIVDFLRLLWAVDHGLAAKSKRMETTLGVTGPQRFVVRMVGHYPGVSAGKLAGLLHLHPSTLTGILRRLEARGFLVRHVDPNDARRARFDLTDKGRELDGVRTGTVEASVTKALKHASARKLDAAREVLIALARELSDE